MLSACYFFAQKIPAIFLSPVSLNTIFPHRFRSQHNLPIFEAKKSIRKKIKNIPQHGRIRLIELGVTAAGAGDGGEFFVLDVKYFGESATGGAKDAGFVTGVAAFRANKT